MIKVHKVEIFYCDIVVKSSFIWGIFKRWIDCQTEEDLFVDKSSPFYDLLYHSLIIWAIFLVFSKLVIKWFFFTINFFFFCFHSILIETSFFMQPLCNTNNTLNFQNHVQFFRELSLFHSDIWLDSIVAKKRKFQTRYKCFYLFAYLAFCNHSP